MKRQLGLLLLSLMSLPLCAQTTSGTIGAYTLTPEAGSTVEEIESVKIQFLDLGFWWLASPDCSAVTLTSDGGAVYKVVKTEGNMENYCTMYFGRGTEPERITEGGTYTLTIPEGIFKQDFSEDKYNAEITAEYKIEVAVPNSLSNYELTPATESTVSRLDAVNIKFPEAAATGISVQDNLAQITLTSDGTTYVCVSAEVTDGVNVSLKFGKEPGGEALEFERPGEYSLYIPKNVFTATGTEESNIWRLETVYTIDNPDFDPLAEVEVNPAQGEMVASFQDISVTFPNADRGLNFPDLSGVKLSINGVSTDYVAGNLRMPSPYNGVIFSFSEEMYGEAVNFAQSGTYSVTIPAGVFSESGSADYKSKEITVTFKVQNPEDANPFNNYLSVPAAGETVGEIYELSLTFPELSESGIKWPIDVSAVTLQRTGDDVVYTGNSVVLSQNNNVITGFGPAGSEYSEKLHFRTPGEYVVKVPAGTFASEADSDVVNNAMEFRFTVDASYNFTYKLNPDPEQVQASLSKIEITAADVLTSISLAEGSELNAVLSSGLEEIGMTATTTEDGVILTPEKEVLPGEWALTVPAGMLSGVNNDGLDVVNARQINAKYVVKTPQQYSYTTTPAQGETVALFTKYTVSIAGKPKQVMVDAEAGMPILKGADVEYELISSYSGTDVMFAVKGGASLSDGEYTISIPAGYIVTTDADNLQSGMPAITGMFKVMRPTQADYEEGMLLLNEGWYGHDMASLTHVATDGTVRYNAFVGENPSKSLGLTGTWVGRYGDNLYVVCKQSGIGLNGVEGGILTQIDGASLAYVDQINDTELDEQGHAFCGVSATKGYLSTSKSIYPVNLATMTLGERMTAVQTFNIQYGEMLYYRGHVFATAKNWSPMVIDPADDKMTELEIGPSVVGFVTPDGALYFATLEEGREFVKVDPENLSCEAVSVNAGEYTGRIQIADIWDTYTAAPLAVDAKANVVYYATEPNATAVARLDLDNGEFTPEYIKLPASASGQQCLYGQGISLDPTTGEIVLTAVEQGYGLHYKQNYVYRVNPATGEIKDDRTLKLSEYYWFPSMAIYGGFKAPELDLSDITLADDDVTLDLYAHTTLALGNKHQIEYTVESSNPEVCAVEQTAPAVYVLKPVGAGSSTVTVTADYQGLVTTAEFVAGTVGINHVESADARVDVYTPDGILVLKSASPEEIRRLPAGLYITAGSKIYVR